MSSEASAVRPGSRAIARAAVQAELSLAAYELVVEKGYGNVTLDDMAAAGGVSRSTFLRYFGTKDQAILVALEAYVERMADTLRARPRDEDDWSALCSAIEASIGPIYIKHPAGAQAITRLAMFTQALSGAQLERQNWRTPLTRALAERHGVSEPAPIGLAVKVGAALECMGLAISYWIAADGTVDLIDLLRDGFTGLSGKNP
ncbi:MAG TPA: TetR/AcrR family transcriptional regulator [Trebonia sp.]